MSRNKPSSPPAAGRMAGAAKAGTPPVPGAAGAGGTGAAEGATGPALDGATGLGGTGAAGPTEGGPGPAFDTDASSDVLGGAGATSPAEGFGSGRPSGGLGGDLRDEAQLRDYAHRTIEGDVSRPVTGVGAEAAATLATARPQEAARVLQAAAGSATEAPSIGAGGLVDLAAREIPGAVAVGVPVSARIGEAAGVAPGLFDAGGSHGPAPEPGPDLYGEHLARRMLLDAQMGLQPLTGAKLAVPQPGTSEELHLLRDAGFDMVITSRQLNFRRAGVIHPTSPTVRRTGDFTPIELEMLVGEPMLVVTWL